MFQWNQSKILAKHLDIPIIRFIVFYCFSASHGQYWWDDRWFFLTCSLLTPEGKKGHNVMSKTWITEYLTALTGSVALQTLRLLPSSLDLCKISVGHCYNTSSFENVKHEHDGDVMLCWTFVVQFISYKFLIRRYLIIQISKYLPMYIVHP